MLGAEIAALLAVFGLYFLASKKWTLFNNLHVMGEYRTWLLLGASTLVAVPFFFGQVPANGFIAFAITFVAVYVMTVEFVIRLGLSLFLGGVAFRITAGLGLLLFKDKDS